MTSKGKKSKVGQKMGQFSAEKAKLNWAFTNNGIPRRVTTQTLVVDSVVALVGTNLKRTYRSCKKPSHPNSAKWDMKRKKSSRFDPIIMLQFDKSKNLGSQQSIRLLHWARSIFGTAEQIAWRAVATNNSQIWLQPAGNICQWAAPSATNYRDSQ